MSACAGLVESFVDLRAKEKMVPADWAPKMIAEKQTKNWNIVYSWSAIRLPPYQNPSATQANIKDCAAA
jgi:hypothetical protein